MSWFGSQKPRISAGFQRYRLACSSILPGLLPLVLVDPANPQSLRQEIGFLLVHPAGLH
jgi:hypothetical protein